MVYPHKYNHITYFSNRILNPVVVEWILVKVSPSIDSEKNPAALPDPVESGPFKFTT